MRHPVYYLPGRGGQLKTGLGEGLASRGVSVVGRETVGTFRELSFQEQIDTICDDLRLSFWHEEAHVVAVSYGAYLFLHAQAQLPSFPGKVLLLSPILGQFSNDVIGIGLVPPRAAMLRQLVEEGKYPVPPNCEIHVGSEDWQSNPAAVSEIGVKTGISITVVPNAGHQLGVEYVGALLDQWLH